MGKQIIKTEFLCESFYRLNQMDQLEKNIISLTKQPDIEAVISGGLDDDFVYGIHLKVYKRIYSEEVTDIKKTPSNNKTRVLLVDGVAVRTPIVEN